MLRTIGIPVAIAALLVACASGIRQAPDSRHSSDDRMSGTDGFRSAIGTTDDDDD